MTPEQALQRLARAGIVAKEGAEWRTIDKWAQALMRAEERITVEYVGEAIEDLRLPVTYALVDLLGPDVPEPELKAMVDAILPIELREEEEMEPEVGVGEGEEELEV